MNKRLKTITIPLLATSLILSSIAPVLAADNVRVGLMLPSTGTYARLGSAITNGFKLFVDENGGKLGGKKVDYFIVDDESKPAKATEKAKKLVKRDKVDVLVGTVHSGVAVAMAKVARDSKTLMIIPNAGSNPLTGAICNEGLFRSSFSMWQPSYAMGKVMAEKGIKRVATFTWKYAAGTQSVDGFKEAFEKGGGKVIKQLTIPFPNVEFQAYLTEIAALKPDAVFVFFAGGAAVKFVKDYAAVGLKDTTPLYATGFLTEGTLAAMGGAGEGLLTTLHYADGLDNDKNIMFRESFTKAFGKAPDVYAVQGYDAAQLYHAGLIAAGGDTSKRAAIINGMENAKIDSPRGSFIISKAHNPIQNIYLRKAVGNKNYVQSIPSKNLADPAIGCSLN